MILSVYDHFALQAGGQVKPSIRRQQKNCNNNINRLLLNLDEERVNIDLIPIHMYESIQPL